MSSDGRTVVYAAEDEASPPELWVADAVFHRRRQVTHLNPHLDGVARGRSRLISWVTPEGKPACGTLLLPPGYQGGQRLPLVVSIYPGLSLSNWMRQWEAGPGSGVLHLQLLEGRGYAVLLPDIPSSGVAVVPPPLGLAGAVLAGVDEAIRVDIADGERLGVMGQSGGGTAVNRLVTETTRFRAAVSSAGAADLASFFGQLRVRSDGRPDTYGVHLAEEQCGGPPWAAPRRYVTDSPIFSLDRVETPLLLFHGTEDDTVGVEQAGEMFVGLLRLKKEVTLLRYRGEGHSPAGYGEANRRDVVARVLAWFDEHLGPTARRSLA